MCLLSQEQEYFQEELRRVQKKLLRVSRDKRYTEEMVSVLNRLFSFKTEHF